MYSQKGYCLLELLFVGWLGLVLTVAVVPNILASMDERRAAGAVRYLTTRCASARLEAVRTSRDVAVRFAQAGREYSYAVYADGNGDGVRTRDIQRGVDVQLTPIERLSTDFPGVGLAVPSGLPPVDSGSPIDGDPLKLGSGNLLSYSPQGTSTSGSIYVRGRSGAQYVIKALGETGRLRTLKFNSRWKRWDPA